MCPLRIVLVFLSAALTGYFAWKTARPPAPSPLDAAGEAGTGEDGDSREARRFDLGKAVGNGFWVLADMASGKYLWRYLSASASAKGR